MDLVPSRDGVDRLDAFQGFESDFGFKLGTVLTTFFGQGDRWVGALELTIPPVQLLGSTPDSVDGERE